MPSWRTATLPILNAAVQHWRSCERRDKFRGTGIHSRGPAAAAVLDGAPGPSLLLHAARMLKFTMRTDDSVHFKMRTHKPLFRMVSDVDPGHGGGLARLGGFQVDIGRDFGRPCPSVANHWRL